jgi:hypothetical protein
VRARCERTAVEPCRATSSVEASFGLVMPILSVGVGRGRAIGWVCKVAGSSPARSILEELLICRNFLCSGVEIDNSGASAVRADLRFVSVGVE